jgi:hypothetical protein
MKVTNIFTWFALALAISLSACKKTNVPEPEPASSEVILYDSDQNQEVRAEITSDHQERNANTISCLWVGSTTFMNGCTFRDDISPCAIGYNLIIFRVKGIKGGHPVTIKVTSKSGLSNTIDLVVQPGTCVLLDVFKS